MMRNQVFTLAFAAGIGATLFLAQCALGQPPQRSSGFEEPIVPGSDDSSIPVAIPEDTRAENEILRSLEKRIAIDPTGVTIEGMIAEVARRIDALIVIDRKSLEEAGVDPDQPAPPVVCDEFRARDYFDLVFKDLELGWIIWREALVITTKENVDNCLQIRVYPVKDLVDDGRGSADYSSLIDMITSVVSPTSWDEVGGPGSMAQYLRPGVLVISQTRSIHEEIATLLAALRKARDWQKPAPATTFSKETPPQRPGIEGDDLRTLGAEAGHEQRFLGGQRSLIQRKDDSVGEGRNAAGHGIF